MDPKDRHIVVTGASSGIGRAASIALARRGARLTITARREGELARTATACRAAGAECETVVADLSRQEECVRLIGAATARFGPVDVLVNNAGFAIFDAIAHARAEDALGMMATNYFGALWCIQAALPQMLERRAGAIVNVGSIAGLMGYARMGGYSASKFALTGMTEALRGRGQEKGVRVSLVGPGDDGYGVFRDGRTREDARRVAHGPRHSPGAGGEGDRPGDRRRDGCGSILPFPAALFPPIQGNLSRARHTS